MSVPYVVFRAIVWYHVDDTKGVAKGNEPESLYAVMSGTHFNGRCCFDYGNSENTRLQPVKTGDSSGSMHVCLATGGGALCCHAGSSIR